MNTAATVEVPADELAQMRQQLGAIEKCLHDAFAFLPTIPDDAKKAMAARIAARARGFFWAFEFAAVVGKHKQWVTDNCAAGVIRTLLGEKPYRIPLTEESRWNSDPTNS